MLLLVQEHPAGAFHQRLSWKFLFPPRSANTYPGLEAAAVIEDAAQVSEDVVVDVVVGAYQEQLTRSSSITLL